MKLFSRKHNHRDELTYLIPENAIEDSVKVFREYAAEYPSNEGIVYWAGTREKQKNIIRYVVAPKAETHWGGVRVSHDANFEFVKFLTKNKLVQIGQVHTHPGRWVDHSDGDNRDAAFKVNGLLSLVVPHYGKKGMTPLSKCGVHRFWDGRFTRLSNKYIRKHFIVSSGLESHFEDLR